MESGQISGDSITASSQRRLSAPQYARLHFSEGAWMPQRMDHNPWLQVDLGNDTQITGISIQGHYFARCWVKTYSVRYSKDGLNYEVYHSGQKAEVKSQIKIISEISVQFCFVLLVCLFVCLFCFVFSFLFAWFGVHVLVEENR